MHEQLGFNTMHTGRLLQSFDDVGDQAILDGVLSLAVGEAFFGNEEIANHSLAAFIDKEGISVQAPALDGGITGKDAGIDVAEDHVRRRRIVPRE